MLIGRGHCGWFIFMLLQGRKYELVATITHHGREPSKGHYTADAQYPNGRWLRFDDASVFAIGTNKVLHDQAYVLFYRQLWKYSCCVKYLLPSCTWHKNITPPIKRDCQLISILHGENVGDYLLAGQCPLLRAQCHKWLIQFSVWEE